MTRTLKDLPINIQTFEDIRKDNFIYVDKTKIIYELVRKKSTYFLSRPRRFGKSLLVSTLEAIFLGRKELFEDLTISKTDYAWPVHPVIKLDFGIIPHGSVDELRLSLCSELLVISELYGLELKENKNPVEILKALIRKLSQKNKVVILIDEYDKPILDHIDNLDVARSIQQILKSFYEAIKALDAHIRFIFLTGITKFTKTSVFSSLNNLNDISEVKMGATLLGYTQAEIEHYFADHLKQSAQEMGMTVKPMLTDMKEWYNGYQFCMAQSLERVYSPLSVMYCLNNKAFKNFWFDTATSSHLVNLISLGRYNLSMLEKLEPIRAGDTVFSPCDLSSVSLEALLYQAGYLTIASYDQDAEIAMLDFPNKEVRESMRILLISMKTEVSTVQVKPAIHDIKMGFLNHNIALVANGLQIMVAQIPFMHHKPDEHYYHDLFHMVLVTIGFNVTSEQNVHRGKPDLIVDTGKQIFVLELKLNKSTKEALDQIKNRRYYEKYQLEGKPITLVGVNFEFDEKKLDIQYVIEDLI